MTWLTWRQFRTGGVVTAAALTVAAVVLAITGANLADLYQNGVAGCLGQRGATSCSQDALASFTASYTFLQHFFGYALIGIPALIGAFWGAPLLTREVEAGTHRLVWTQSVTRTRWLAVKVTLVGAASALATGLLSLMVTWWSGSLDRVNANRLTPPVFDQRAIAPLGWALLAFAVGVTAGLLIRRTVPAMAVTLAVFTTARILWPLYVRPYLIPPVHLDARVGTLPFDWVGVNAGPQSPMLVHVSMPGAWMLSDRTVNAAGQQVAGGTLFPLCPPPADSSGLKHAPDSCFIQHLVQLGYSRSVLTYQPASRFWALQWVETGALVAVALLLLTFCFWWVRRGKVT
jgi:hypothetical protein